MKRQILAKRLKIRDYQRICEGTCSPSQPVNWNCRQAANLSHSKSKEKVKIGCMMVWGWLKPESLDLCLWMEGVFGVFHCKLRPGLPSRQHWPTFHLDMGLQFIPGSLTEPKLSGPGPRNVCSWWVLSIAFVSRPCPATNASSSRSPAASYPAADVATFFVCSETWWNVWSVGFILRRMYGVEMWRAKKDNIS